MKTEKRPKFDPQTQAIIDLTNAVHAWRDSVLYPRRWYHPLVNSGLFKVVLFAGIGGGIGGCAGYFIATAVYVAVHR